ncbi:copper resistance protein B [Dyella sp. C11]|uniref:copper resistance protein B n=1 Tax=Dyella sp. C11 TaxID=2126991 RepID=UPI000D650475|nr:copper resistance protein B [Dyella sp. C11]
MKNALAFAIAAMSASLPLPLLAQSMDMQDMPGMTMPSPQDHDHAHDAPPPSAPMPMPMPMDHANHDMASMDAPPLPPNDHVPPPAPQYTPHDMTPSQMNAMMQMDDNASLGMFMLDRLERSRSTGGDYAISWEAEGWYGNPIDRVWLKTEGERTSDGTEDGRLELLWSHAWSSFWDGQLGVRQDFGRGPNRQWLAAGVEGLAPCWFETQATFYVGEEGRTALRLETSYDMRFTQRLILTPQIELNVYGKDDPQRGVSSGLSDVQAGLRLRYEFSRKLAPYVGVDWMRRFGNASDVPGMPVWHARETTWVAGVRIWL